MNQAIVKTTTADRRYPVWKRIGLWHETVVVERRKSAFVVFVCPGEGTISMYS